MHVLVTGAAGFSGLQIVQALLGAGHRVTAVVRTNSGGLTTNLAPARDLGIIEDDLALTVAFPARYDAVVHAAARSPGAGVTTQQIVHDNIVATYRLIRHAKNAGVHTFIFFSSLSVYGNVDAAVVDETTPVRDPAAYGLSKRIGEELLTSESDSFRWLALRLPGVIGPGSARNWLSTVLHAARIGSEIAVYNPAAPFNNAVHVADLRAFVVDLLQGDWEGGESATLGAEGQITVEDAVRLLVHAFADRSKVTIKLGERPSFIVSSRRAQIRYGYKPMEIRPMLRRFAEENGGRFGADDSGSFSADKSNI